MKLIKHKKLFAIVALTSVLMLTLGVSVALAQPKATAQQIEKLEIEDVLKRFVRVAIGILALIAVVVIVGAGIWWVTAAGDATKQETARKMIVGAIWGLVFALIAYGIVEIVIRIVIGTGISP